MAGRDYFSNPSLEVAISFTPSSNGTPIEEVPLKITLIGIREFNVPENEWKSFSDFEKDSDLSEESLKSAVEGIISSRYKIDSLELPGEISEEDKLILEKKLKG